MPNLHSNDDINKFTDYFENWCDIKNEDFEDAISWFENVIENPDTPEDSIFAIIDIAYTYNLMDTLNLRYVGKYPELKPVSRSQFTKDREILIDKLFNLKHSNYSEEFGNDSSIINDIKIYPSPVNLNLNINFTLNSSSLISIELYNLIGQRIKTIFDGRLNEGPHSLKFKTYTIKSGMYILVINSNSTKVCRNKVLILNN